MGTFKNEKRIEGFSTPHIKCLPAAIEPLSPSLPRYQPSIHFNSGIKAYLASSSEALKPSSLDRAGIDKTMHHHQLRQSYATHLLNNGAPLDVIQSLLGHENSETTRIYAQLSGKLRRELYRKYF
nr:tyrosine-type recombinase/integrase [Paraliobacillus sediminis]